ncbi:MAG: hypothetical protein IPG72_01560 [Ardenticatenales bacterium]|nr:hypothetical protein [Ardenticatenales bacterium]
MNARAPAPTDRVRESEHDWQSPTQSHVAERSPRRARRPDKRTTLIATVPTASASPRRCYDFGDESDEEIAAIIVADLLADEAPQP